MFQKNDDVKYINICFDYIEFYYSDRLKTIKTYSA